MQVKVIKAETTNTNTKNKLIRNEANTGYIYTEPNLFGFKRPRRIKTVHTNTSVRN